MSTVSRRVLVSPPGYRSREAGLFVAQLEDLSARLSADIRDLTPAALAWQPAPGTNTIGMLLAHIAIVEVYWTQVGPLGLTTFETESVLAIGMDDDGMPLGEGAAPPAALRGKDLAFYTDLLLRAREHSRQALARLTDPDLDREVTRRGSDGAVRGLLNLRWILYHMVEHLAGHHGQINLLKHQHRLTAARP